MKPVNFYCFNGEVITPENPNYESARQEWNRGVQKFPIAIAYCTDEQDVREAIWWARQECCGIRIRSGGHNYEGYSTGDKVLVIDVSRLKQIKLDEEAGTVTIQGGVQNQDFYAAVSGKGYPFPGGICPTVGVSGYTLGGGWGYSARYFGLGCDSLIELRLIDSEGHIVVANERQNSDLFWACRGAGGGNFGVVVELTFKLPPKVEKVVGFEVYHPQATPDEILKFLQTWQKWIDSVDTKINMNGGLYHTAKEGSYVYGRGLCYGDLAYTQLLLAPFEKLPGVRIYLEEGTFLEVIERFEATYPPYEYFKSTGRFTNRLFPRFELEEVVAIVGQPLPQGALLTAINFYGLGGKVKEVAPCDTAFYYRDSKFILSIQAVWEDNQYKAPNVEWVQKNFPSIYSITRGSFVNFPYGELKDYEYEYFGENVPCLQAVKEKYDACNIFNFPQSIRS